MVKFGNEVEPPTNKADGYFLSQKKYLTSMSVKPEPNPKTKTKSQSDSVEPRLGFFKKILLSSYIFKAKKSL